MNTMLYNWLTVLSIQISTGNNFPWNKIQFPTYQKKQSFDTTHNTHTKCYLLYTICKRKFHVTCICCSAYNHHLQRIHAHCHWETCGFGIHMGPHNQCRALLVWIQHVTLTEQKQKLKIITNLKQNDHPLLSPHTRIGMLFPLAYICK